MKKWVEEVLSRFAKVEEPFSWQPVSSEEFDGGLAGPCLQTGLILRELEVVVVGASQGKILEVFVAERDQVTAERKDLALSQQKS